MSTYVRPSLMKLPIRTKNLIGEQGSRSAVPADRRDHIVRVAASVFISEGFGACSMSSIEARLGGSKATLYKYFRSKEQLFEAVVTHLLVRALEPPRALHSGNEEDLETRLYGFGIGFLTMVYDAEISAAYRLIEAEGARFPALVEAFIRRGPNALIEELRIILERSSATQQFTCEDPELAAGQFLGLLRGDRHMRFAMGHLPAPTPMEIAYYARQATLIFMYGLTTIRRGRS